MPAGRENARKRKAPAAPRPVLTIEVIDGPTKGQKFTKQVRSGAIRETRARVRSHALAAVTRASRASPRVALGGVVVFFSLRKFPSVFPFRRAFCFESARLA